ncbi:MAG TPA: winged helix-turn-helix domain-containing protein [Candidatus Nanopelagicales bacterium]|jgi:DNA-binding transcriptional ArsR family regulator|nr:winged helix-turn-helix domain-containing protein [Candidatus Nanopelagicales bacterium]
MSEQTPPQAPLEQAPPAGAGPAPDSAIAVDSRTIKGLAHPLRVRLLGLLRAHGSATATELGRRVGESSGVTSYHLRQLAAYGFVEEDEGRGNRRERWWRARHRMTHFDPDALDEDTRALGDEYLRSVGSTYSRRIEDYLDTRVSRADELGASWQHAFTISDDFLWLTAAQSTRLVGELDELVGRYRQEAGADRTGRRPVVAQYQVMPLAADEDMSWPS